MGLTEDRTNGRGVGYERVFAALYDVLLWAGERAGMHRRRRELLRHARGTVLELGAGTGLNLGCYPAGIDELILAEPEPAMRRRLEHRLARSDLPGRVIADPAERLTARDGSVDTVVSTLVLCTVESPAAALAEIKRVLRPGGRLLFLEHVRADSPRLASWQDRLERPWRWFAVGCRCNRRTEATISAAGMNVEELEHASWTAMVPLVAPLIIGQASTT